MRCTPPGNAPPGSAPGETEQSSSYYKLGIEVFYCQAPGRPGGIAQGHNENQEATPFAFLRSLRMHAFQATLGVYSLHDTI